MKQNWTQSCDGRLNKYWDEIINRAEELGYVTHLSQYRPYLRKATSQSFGVCCTHYHGGGRSTSEICFSNLILEAKTETLIETVAHEIAHAITPRDKHGWEWRRTANELLEPYNLKVSQYLTDNEIVNKMNKISESRKENPYRWNLVCDICGTVVMRYKSKPARIRYLHAKDHGTCHLEKIEQ